MRTRQPIEAADKVSRCGLGCLQTRCKNPGHDQGHRTASENTTRPSDLNWLALGGIRQHRATRPSNFKTGEPARVAWLVRFPSPPLSSLLRGLRSDQAGSCYPMLPDVPIRPSPHDAGTAVPRPPPHIIAQGNGGCGLRSRRGHRTRPGARLPTTFSFPRCIGPTNSLQISREPIGWLVP